MRYDEEQTLPGEATDEELAALEIAFGQLEAVRIRAGRQARDLRPAYELALRAHAGQRRMSGEPYLAHPLAVATILAGYGLDDDSIIAGLLHDAVEDSEVTLDEVAAVAGPSVAELVDGVTKLARAANSTREERQAAALRKLIVAMAEDLRVLLVKLADRLHNIRTLEALEPERRRAIAEETLEVYAPLAHRLGAQDIKHELEDACFKELHPLRFDEIDRMIASRAPRRDKVLSQVLEEILAGLTTAGIEAEVSGRPKRHYSIYRKMTASGLDFDEIHDLIGVRIIVSDTAACYGALGVVHGAYQPLHGRFKDYIATPKFNLYQSLHTTVIGPDGRALEVQIRSRRMHDLAEYGIAAHWRYKEGPAAKEIPWVADLARTGREQTDPLEFLRSVKLDLYADEIFVATPRGDVLHLPQGATPVDFAYGVHTEVGNHCAGARVNGRVVPLDTPLRSGDVVEILTSYRLGAAPSKDWVSFVTTARARHGIRQWFSRRRRSENIGPGHQLLEDALRAEGADLGSGVESYAAAVAGDFGLADAGAVLTAVGEGTIGAAAVALRAVNPALSGQTGARQDRTAQEALLLADGLDGLRVRYAQCCHPLPGDPVIGFLTTGRGVSAHRADCLRVGALDRGRLVELAWADAGNPRQSFQMTISALDRAGLLAEVTTVIAECAGFVVDAAVRTDGGVAEMVFTVRVADERQAELVRSAASALGGVFEAALAPVD